KTGLPYLPVGLPSIHRGLLRAPAACSVAATWSAPARTAGQRTATMASAAPTTYATSGSGFSSAQVSHEIMKTRSAKPVRFLFLTVVSGVAERSAFKGYAE